MGLNETGQRIDLSGTSLNLYLYIKYIYMNLKSEWIHEVTLVSRHARETLLHLL